MFRWPLREAAREPESLNVWRRMRVLDVSLLGDHGGKLSNEPADVTGGAFDHVGDGADGGGAAAGTATTISTMSRADASVFIESLITT